MLPAGQPAPLPAPALNCTRVQTVLMWDCSRNSEWGSWTEILAELASPALGRNTACRAGWAPRLVPPLRLSESAGLKPRLAQSAAWKGVDTVTGRSSASEPKFRPEPKTVEAVEVRLQLVGFKTNSGPST